MQVVNMPLDIWCPVVTFEVANVVHTMPVCTVETEKTCFICDLGQCFFQSWNPGVYLR